jgi:hypothetical protein
MIRTMNRRICAQALVVFLLSLGPSARAGDDVAKTIDKVMQEQSARIPREAMIKAFDYYQQHSSEVKNKAYVTIVDFNRPSTEKRMHVIDMKTGDVEDLLVAHGTNSGNLYASKFSNDNGSKQSSLGIYLTAETYIGKHGLSLRLDGMEKTNNNARKRDIVLHGATYVSDETIQKQGRLGKSWGCPAVPQPDSERLVKQLKDKSVLLLYRGTGPEAGQDKDEKIESGKQDE